MSALSNIILHSFLIFKQRLWLPSDIAQLLSQCSYAVSMDAMFEDITPARSEPTLWPATSYENVTIWSLYFGRFWSQYVNAECTST